MKTAITLKDREHSFDYLMGEHIIAGNQIHHYREMLETDLNEMDRKIYEDAIEELIKRQNLFTELIDNVMTI